MDKVNGWVGLINVIYSLYVVCLGVTTKFRNLKLLFDILTDFLAGFLTQSHDLFASRFQSECVLPSCFQYFFSALTHHRYLTLICLKRILSFVLFLWPKLAPLNEMAPVKA